VTHPLWVGGRAEEDPGLSEAKPGVLLREEELRPG